MKQQKEFFEEVLQQKGGDRARMRTWVGLDIRASLSFLYKHESLGLLWSMTPWFSLNRLQSYAAAKVMIVYNKILIS